MNAAENKQHMRQIFDELAKGNTAPFVASLADDIRWTITGSSRVSRTFDGKPALVAGLLAPIQQLFGDGLAIAAHRLIAEDDVVVAECRGRGTTKDGREYNNTYCWVMRLVDGKVIELNEYLDTALVDKVFGK